LVVGPFDGGDAEEHCALAVEEAAESEGVASDFEEARARVGFGVGLETGGAFPNEVPAFSVAIELGTAIGVVEGAINGGVQGGGFAFIEGEAVGEAVPFVQ